MLTRHTRQNYLGAQLGVFSALCFACFTSSCGPTPSPSASTPTAPSTAQNPASVYENKLVRRPGNSVEDGKVYLVQNGKKRWVVNASWLEAHGYKFPNDVHEIPTVDLDAMPSGDPIL
jgi:hypothetical protein